MFGFEFWFLFFLFRNGYYSLVFRFNFFIGIVGCMNIRYKSYRFRIVGLISGLWYECMGKEELIFGEIVRVRYWIVEVWLIVDRDLGIKSFMWVMRK